MSRKTVGLALGVAGSVAFLAFGADLVRDRNTAIELRSQFESKESDTSDGARNPQNQAQHSELDAIQERGSGSTHYLIGPEDPRLPADQDHLADVYNNLAMTYRVQGRLAEAEEFHRRELEIYRSTHGLDSPKVAQSLDNLAHLYIDQGRYQEAEPIYRRALTIWEKILGSDNALLAKEQEHYSDLLRKIGRSTEPGKQLPT